MDRDRVAVQLVAQPEALDGGVDGRDRQGQKRAHHASELPAHGHRDEHCQLRERELVAVDLGGDEIIL